MRGERFDRRHFLAMSALGLAATVAGCGTESRGAGPPPATVATEPAPTGTPTTATGATKASALPPPTFPPPRPGPPQVLGRKVLPHETRFALTIDDGYDAATADAYVAWALQTGIHITFSPNGVYDKIWRPLGSLLRPAISAGQVQIGNHTFSHPYLTRLSPAGIADQLQRNEGWIEDVFGITARPWYRPPYGAHNARVDDVAGSLGFTHVCMWDGSLGDAVLLTPDVLMQQAQLYLTGGRVVLGHANHPTVTGLFDQLMGLIASRGLQPVTLDELFGTSRATG